MSNVKIVLNSEGIQELLKSAEVMAECRSHAAEMAATLGTNDYEVIKPFPYAGTYNVEIGVRDVILEKNGEKIGDYAAIAVALL